MSRSSHVVAVLATGALLALAGCGGTPTGGGSGSADVDDTVAALNALSGDAQRKEAERRAKEEGALTLYTNINADASQDLAKAFQTATGIEVEVFRTSSETLLQRVTQEADAGRRGGDVVFGSFDAVSALGQEQRFASYEGGARKALAGDLRFDRWTEAAAEVFTPAWNTERVDRAPTSWEDLADPRFDGEMALEAGDAAWYASLTRFWREHGKSQAEVDRLWQGIVKGARVASGHSAMVELLAGGQTAVNAANYDYLIRRTEGKGAPVAYPKGAATKRLPLFPSPLGVGVAANAAHPAAGWLFADWLLGEKGQRFLADSGLVTAEMLSDRDVVDDLELAPFAAQEMTTERRKWEDRFDALLRGVPKE